MASVFWTDEALKYIAEIYKHIAEDSPQNAENFLNALMDRVEMQLSVSAEIGRITPEFHDPKKREIIYKYTENTRDFNHEMNQCTLFPRKMRESG